MNSMWKRSFALLLSLVMVFGMVPVNAFAEDTAAVTCDGTAECQAVADHAEGCLKAIAEAEAAKAAEEAAKAAAEAAKAAEEAAAKAAEEAAKAAEEAAAKAAEEAAKAAEEAANQPSVCNKQEDCPAAENHAEDCLKAIADAEAAKAAAEAAAKAASEAAALVCDGTENCAAETHETTCECYDWCAALGCSEESHHADCPWGPCTLTEGCELVKNHPGECTGAGVFALAGEGTAESPYLINNIDDLKWFRDDVNRFANDGSSQYAGKYFKLTADIDLKNEEWTPIGSTTGDHGSFYGSFDGDGHTISNLRISRHGTGSGFFAKTSGGGDGPQATVKNITFHNVDVDAGNGNSYAGGVIANSGGNTVVSNVHLTGDVYVNGYGYVGGIVGHGYPKMDGCSVDTNAGSYIHSNYWCAGALVGYAGEGTSVSNSTVENISVWGASGGAGAAIGRASKHGSQVCSLTNVSATNVEVTGANYYSGYIAGNGSTAVMNNVTATNVTLGQGIVDPLFNVSIGDTRYPNLQAAFSAGGEVKLLENVDLPTAQVISKKIILDLNGKTVSVSKDTAGDGVFRVISGGDLTINGEGTVNGVGQNDYNMAIWADGGKVTINGGTYTNEGASAVSDPTHMDLIYVKNGGEVVINGGTFKGATPAWLLNSNDTAKGTIKVYGGTFHGFNPADNACENPKVNFVAIGYKATENNGVYTVEVDPAQIVATVNGVNYFTLADAIATGAKEIVLQNSTKLPTAQVINSQLTINLNGKTISVPEDTAGDGVFRVVAGGDLTINGEGTVNGVGKNDYNMAIWADGGKVTINGGTYTNEGATAVSDPTHMDLIYVKNGGEVVINGGSFKGATPAWLLNSNDTAKGTIKVYGGTFHGFNPADNACENPKVNFVAIGYKATENNGVYTVEVDPAQIVATINGVNYFTLAEAIATGAKEIVLQNSTKLPTAQVINSQLTINLNGKTISVPEDTAGDGVFHVVSGGDLTINGEGTVNGVGKNDYNMAIWADGGKVTINGGTYTNEGATAVSDPTHMDLIYVKNGGEVVINGGIFKGATPAWLLNSHDTNKGTIKVYGGTFHGFNPGNNACEGAGTSFLAVGYEATGSNGVYTVAKAEVMAEKPNVTVAPEAAGDTYADEIIGSNANATNTELTEQLDKVATKEVVDALLPELQKVVETAGKSDEILNTQVGTLVEYRGSETAADGTVTFTYHVEPQLQAVDEAGNVVAGVKIPNSDIQAANTKLTVRLDVVAPVEVKFIQINHVTSGGVTENMGLFPIIREGGKCYVEFESDSFSIYTATIKSDVESLNAALNGKKFATIEDALDEIATVPGNHTITLIESTSEDFRINQTEGVNITVTAAEGVVYSGTIKIDGKARSTGTETVTISGITFSTTEKDHRFIDAAWINGEPYNYAHNVTVKNCHFQGTGADSGVVGIKGRQVYGLEVIDCTADGVACFIDSLNTINKLNITRCTVTNAKVGIEIQGEESVNITKCNITAAEYGVRFAQDSDNNVIKIDGSTVKTTGANSAPIHIWSDGKSSQLKIDAATSTLTPAAGNTVITYKDATVSDTGKIELSLPSNAAAPASSVAKIGNTYYNDISVAVAAWKANGGTMTLLADVDNMNVEISKTAVLDRNGHKVGYIGTTSFTVVANGNLTLKDSNPTSNDGISNALIGNVTVNGGTFTLESGRLSRGDKVLTVVDGFAEIKGGDLLASGANTTAISVAGGELKISGGDIGGQDYSIQQTGNGKVMICGGKIYGQMSGNRILIPGLVGEKLNTARFDRFDPTSFCQPRYAGYEYEENSYKIVPAAAYVTDNNGTTYYPTVADAVKATGVNDTLTIIADTKDANKDVSVTKNSTMTIAANAQGGVTVTANVPANSKYVQIPVKGVTYRVGAYGDLTISKNGVVGGDNVPIKDGKPDYTLKPLNSEASYLSGSNATLTFESNMIFATFTKAYIDGTEITVNKDYVATPGSTIIELANARLRTLTAGKHTLMIRDDSENTVSCEFYVTVNANADKTNPKTGDAIFVPMFVMFSTAAALAVLVMGKKKYF